LRRASLTSRSSLLNVTTGHMLTVVPLEEIDRRQAVRKKLVVWRTTERSDFLCLLAFPVTLLAQNQGPVLGITVTPVQVDAVVAGLQQPDYSSEREAGGRYALGGHRDLCWNRRSSPARTCFKRLRAIHSRLTNIRWPGSGLIWSW
jgi:hypothetical protein